MEDELIEKEITQLERVEPVVRSLGDMSMFYKQITGKIVADNICFICKKELGEKTAFDIVIVPDSKLEKGIVAFACVCKECNLEE